MAWAVACAGAAEGHVCQFQVVWSVWTGWDLQLSEGEICTAESAEGRSARLEAGTHWLWWREQWKRGPVLGLIKLSISRDIRSVLHVGQICKVSLGVLPQTRLVYYLCITNVVLLWKRQISSTICYKWADFHGTWKEGKNDTDLLLISIS